MNPDSYSSNSTIINYARQGILVPIHLGWNSCNFSDVEQHNQAQKRSHHYWEMINRPEVGWYACRTVLTPKSSSLGCAITTYLGRRSKIEARRGVNDTIKPLLWNRPCKNSLEGEYNTRNTNGSSINLLRSAKQHICGWERNKTPQAGNFGTTSSLSLV